MITKLMELMRKETELFIQAQELEEKKRIAILSARGRELAALNSRSERLALDIESIEKERETLAESYLSIESTATHPVTVNLTSLTEKIRLRNPEHLPSFTKLSSEYRSAAAALKKGVENNRIILESTSRNIGNMFQEIRHLADSSLGKVYKPADGSPLGGSGKERHRSGQSMLLNANA